MCTNAPSGDGPPHGPAATWEPGHRSRIARALAYPAARTQSEEETWRALTAHYGTEQLLYLVFTMGQYTLVSMALNTLGVQLEPAYRSSNGGVTSDNVGSDNSPGDLRLHPTFMQPYGLFAKIAARPPPGEARCASPGWPSWLSPLPMKSKRTPRSRTSRTKLPLTGL